jgi:thiopeptide-type bacteriocin biosynthesis protein
LHVLTGEESVMYRHVDAGLVRLSTHDPELTNLGWPDLDAQGNEGTRIRREWLRRVWAVDSFADAVTQASPVLAARVEAAITADNPHPRTVARVSVSLLRYLLRATTRATPFGLFAGVAPVHLAPRAEVHLGTGHWVTARVDARWLTEIVERVQGDGAVRDHLRVAVNELAVACGDRLVLPCPHRTPTTSTVSVRLSHPVALAVERASDGIRFADLRATVLHELPTATPAAVEGMLVSLLTEGFLVTELTGALTGARALDRVIDIVTRLDPGPEPGGGAASALAELHARRAQLELDLTRVGRTAQASADGGAALPANLDVRVDAKVSVPRAVLVEAEAAAAVLVRVARDDAGRAGWRDYHRRFLDQYGIGALVPVSELLHTGDGLGYPAGFRHSTLAPPRAREQSQRAAWLAALAQDATLHHRREVVLTNADLDRLGPTPAPHPRPHPQPHTDLRVEVHAASREDMDRGAFRLVVIGASRAAGTVTGRFLDLLDPADQDRILETYRRLPTATGGAERVQLRGAPLHPSAAAVMHSPPVLARQIVVGGAGRALDPSQVELCDIAVSADATGLYLVSVTDGTPLEPHLFSAVELVASAHPVLRFLTEIATSSCTPCAPFTWGPEFAMLPFLPRLRVGRTILSSARWVLTSDDLAPDNAAPDGTVSGGAAVLGPAAGVLAWQRRWEVPDRVELREHDRRLGLDLREPAHRHLLRAAVHRNGRVTVAEAPEDGMLGWIEGRAHELVIALAATTGPTHPARPRPTAALVLSTNRAAHHVPGVGDWLSVHLPCRPDQQTTVLTRHLPGLLNELDIRDTDRWWFLRHTDQGHHLRLRFRVACPDEFSSTAAQVGRWAQDLLRAGITGPLRLHTYRPELGRFGDGSLMDAAEAVFATDSAAALAQIDLGANSTNGGELAAVTAVGMLATVTGMLPTDSLVWMRDHAPRTGPTRLDPAVRARAVALASLDHSALTSMLGGDQVLLAWARRDTALHRYRLALAARGIAPDVVLPDLLHLHHTRVYGPDLDAERDCLRAARAAALSQLVRAGRAA